MATYRKQLQDKDGNVIIPAVSVQTADIENGAVTADKIDSATFPFVDYSVETAITLPYTATKAQAIIVAGHGVNNAGFVVYVNNCRVFQTNVNTTAVSGMFYVKAGDVVTRIANGSAIDYAFSYDLKWA